MRFLYVDIDTLRADHLGCCGYHRNISPAIDAIAHDAIRFESVYAYQFVGKRLPGKCVMCRTFSERMTHATPRLRPAIGRERDGKPLPAI